MKCALCESQASVTVIEADGSSMALCSRCLAESENEDDQEAAAILEVIESHRTVN